MSTPPPPGPYPPDRPFQRPDDSGPFREQPVQSPFGDEPFSAAPPFGSQPPPPSPPPPSQHPFGGPAAPQYGATNPYPQAPYPQVPGGYQPYGYTPVVTGRNNPLAIASMVLGIVGIVLFCFYAIPSIIAVVFAVVSLNQFKSQPNTYTGRGMAIAGLVTGLVGVSLLVLLVSAGNFRFWFN